MYVRRIGVLAARSSRIVPVIVVTLLALVPRAARPAAAGVTAHTMLVSVPAAHGARFTTVRALVGPARLPATATSAAVPASCPPGPPPGAVCGTVAVPLDRTHPQSGTIPIFFALFTHTSPGPAQSAILVNQGGPGLATTLGFFGGHFLSLFAPNLDVHDLLLVDDRGRGLSNTIDCPPLQHGTAPFAQAEGACAAQLGPAASFYGSGDVAQDVEAVRAALGYDKVDYYGTSYGGADVTAYATRFGAHLRSLVLDAPFGTPALDPFVHIHAQTHAVTRMVSLDCAYSPTCRADHPGGGADLTCADSGSCGADSSSPAAALDWLVRTIRAHPVEGDAYDQNGNLMHVRIDETYLLFYIITTGFPSGNFASTGELVAAATALRQGDPAPLLRLGAEGFFSGFPSPLGDAGDPTLSSRGAELATACADAAEPWDWSAPPATRRAQYAEAVDELPPHYFAPFSKAAATGLLAGISAAQCLWWQKPTPSSPVAPPHPSYPNVPTLVLDGNMDDAVPLELVTRVAALFPGSTLVPVAASGHVTVFWSHCAANLVSRFVETLQVGDTSCTRTPETVWPAVGRFPLLAQDAVPAAIDPNGHNQIGEAERKVVTVAVAAATDAMQRSLLSFSTPTSSGSDHCLRAGSFTTSYNPPTLSPWTATLTDCAFAQDVTVSGTVTWGAGTVVGGTDNSFVADLVVSGPGTAGGTLHVVGTWQAPGPVGDFTVSGQLGGLNVAALVPEA